MVHHLVFVRFFRPSKGEIMLAKLLVRQYLAVTHVTSTMHQGGSPRFAATAEARPTASIVGRRKGAWRQEVAC